MFQEQSGGPIVHWASRQALVSDPLAIHPRCSPSMFPASPRCQQSRRTVWSSPWPRSSWRFQRTAPVLRGQQRGKGGGRRWAGAEQAPDASVRGPAKAPQAPPSALQAVQGKGSSSGADGATAAGVQSSGGGAPTHLLQVLLVVRVGHQREAGAFLGHRAGNGCADAPGGARQENLLASKQAHGAAEVVGGWGRLQRVGVAGSEGSVGEAVRREERRRVGEESSEALSGQYRL